MAQANAAVEEAKKFIKQGHKLAKGGLFSKANPDEAEKMYEKARKKSRFVKPPSIESVGIHLESLEALAEVRDTMSLYNSAASAMEEAARTCQNAADKKIDKFVDKIPDYLQRGSYYYRMNNQYDLASRLLIRAANVEKDINAAIKILDQAVDIQEEENRYITCHEFYDAAVKFLLQNKRYKDADAFLDRQNKMYGKDAEKYSKRIWRNIFSKMVIQYQLKNVKIAQQIYYQGVEEYGHVSKCDEHGLCEQILSIFANADAEGLLNMQKNAQLGIYLINSVARIAVKLDMKDIKPTVVVEKEEKKEQDIEIQQNIEQAQQELTEDQLKSEIADVELDETGAPIL